MGWYGVRCLFQHRCSDVPSGQNLFEERVVIVQAQSFDEAIETAERDAALYSDSPDVEYLGFAQAYEMSAQPSLRPIEVFSLLRESELDADSYVDAFFATGRERESSV